MGGVLDAVVIGAGSAGLGVSYFLQRHGRVHKVVERGRVGETWRTQRWDSFRLNSTNIRTMLPGDSYDGTDPWGALTHQEFVAYLEAYVDRHRLPVQSGVAVGHPQDVLQSPTTLVGSWAVWIPSSSSCTPGGSSVTCPILSSRRGSWMSWLRSLPGSPGRSTTLPGLEAQPAAAEPSVYQSRYVMWEAASVPHPGHHRAGWNSRPEYAGLQAGY